MIVHLLTDGYMTAIMPIGSKTTCLLSSLTVKPLHHRVTKLSNLPFLPLLFQEIPQQHSRKHNCI